jgi:SAM-dependent methyltransferase
MATLEYLAELQLEKEHYDALYANSDVEAPLPEHIVPRVEWELWSKHVGPIEGKSVLECGSGDGAKAVWLASRGAFVQAVELSPAGVERTRQRAQYHGVGERLRAYTGDCTKLEEVVEPASVDIALGFSVLHHFPPTEFGRSLATVLKPGGHAVFFENSNRNPLYRFLRRIRNNESACGSPLTAEEVKELIRQVGDGEMVFPRFGLFAFSKKYIFKESRVYAFVVDGTDNLINLVPQSRPWSAHMWAVLRKPK